MIFIESSELEFITRGLIESEKGFIGVRTKASTSGSTIGPPADAEYAVEPVEVATMTPSALHSPKGMSLHASSRFIILAVNFEFTTMSFNPHPEITDFPLRKTSKDKRLLLYTGIFPSIKSERRTFHSFFLIPAINPNCPRFTGKTGISRFAQPRQANRTVPSPPKVMTKS